MNHVLNSPIVYLWVFSVGIGVVLLSRLPCPKWRGFTSVIREEDGAGYSLSLALLTPLYTLLVCVVIECTLLLVVKIGVTQAAFAAARSASVWLPAEQVGDTSDARLVGMVHLAAVNSLAPFASSLDSHRVSTSTPAGFANSFHEVYTTFVGGGQKQIRDYSRQKWNYAFAATNVSFDPPLRELMRPRRRDHDEVIEVTVTYEMPFNTSAAGMVFGSPSDLPGANFYSRKVSSSFQLQLERPQSGDRSLGIEYDSVASSHTYHPEAD